MLAKTGPTEMFVLGGTTAGQYQPNLSLDAKVPSFGLLLYLYR
jgi:hypothetical protein